MKKTLHNRGFSLIEVMITMILGLVLIAGIFSVFAGSKRSTDVTTVMIEMQESARFAFNQLTSDIRMAGFHGCNDISNRGPDILATDAPTANLALTASSGSVVISRTAWSPASVLGDPIPPQNTNAIPGSHALSLQFGSSATYPLSNNVGNFGVPNRSADIEVDTSPGVSSELFNMQAGEFAIISNCSGADLIRISSVSKSATEAVIGHTSSVNSSDALSRDYLANLSTKFMRFNSNVYYVGDTGNTTSAGTAITGLYKQTLPYEANNPPIMMVSGVESMRILFGVRTCTNTLGFIPPNSAVLDTSNIESIQIGLLMVSQNAVTDNVDTKTYSLAGQSIVASADDLAGVDTYPRDRRLRLAFNTTVKIRNRHVE